MFAHASSINEKNKTIDMKFISWNVNGLRACKDKGFIEAFRRLDADFFCLQETKMQEGQLDLQFDGYTSYWNYAEKKGYSGTAIYTRHQPLNVTLGIDIEHHDKEGRVITMEMPDFYLVTVYTPNSQDELRRLDYRMTWEDDFRAYLLALNTKKPVIVCGDLNVAHQEIDLKNPKTNAATQASPTKSAPSSPPCSRAALPIPSATSTPTSATFILGGPTASVRVRRMPAGASTISSYPTACAKSSPTLRYIPISTAQTIARWKWTSIFN